jgi:hypothetical protein
LGLRVARGAVHHYIEKPRLFLLLLRLGLQQCRDQPVEEEEGRRVAVVGLVGTRPTE